MKKLFVCLCVVIIFFGVVGCPSNTDNPLTSTTSTTVSKPSADTVVTIPVGDDNSAQVHEPATLILLGTGMFVLGVLGRKRFKK